ncbi:MAG: hypothetical protein AMXMBFR84_49230 [Candidatus Hydrogenedentota bacterium]
MSTYPFARSNSYGLIAIVLIFLSACDSQPAKPGPDAPPPPSDGSFSWKRFDGTDISLLISEHSVTDGIRSVIGEFEDATGIRVSIDALAEDLYFDRMELALRATDGVADVYFFPMDSTGYSQWAAGLVQPLDPFLDNAGMTAPDYDLAGFPSQFLTAATFPPNDANAKLYGIPVSFEAYILFYNKELVGQYLGGQLPQTMDELVAGAKHINEAANGSAAGAVMRGIRSDTILDTVTGMIFNHWGEADAPLPYNVWFDGDWNKPRLTDQRIVNGLKDYAGMMKAGPPNIMAMDWPEATLLFSQGKAAFYIDASLFGPGFEDPMKSAVSGKVGYALLPPALPGGESRTGHWMWGLGLPKNARHPGAGWYFIQWLTSKSMEPRVATFHGGAARLSTWSDPHYTEKLNPEYVRTVQTAMKTSRPTAEFREGWKEHAIEISASIQAMYKGEAPEAVAERLQSKLLELSER